MVDDHTKSIRNILVVLAVIVVFSVLKELSGLLIPLVLAGLLTILGLPLVNFLNRLKIPRIIITLIVAILTMGLVFVIVLLISGTVNQIIADQAFLASQFNKKINLSVIWLDQAIPAVNLEILKGELDNLFAPARIAALLGTVLGSLGDFGSSFILFIIYYLILISSATGYRAYMTYVTGPDQSGHTAEVWRLTQDSISAYMGIKTIISLVTGLVAGLVCWAFGLQFALFWGFLAFIMNYIPSIGSILATAVPILMAVIQFDRVGIIVALAAVLGLSQFIIGSVLDPMIMGNRLRLNTITVIFGLLFWGYIWGIPGMLLSVPLMVMVRLLLERTEDFAIVARVMGNPEKPGKKRKSLFGRIVDKAGKGTVPATSGAIGTPDG